MFAWISSVFPPAITYFLLVVSGTLVGSEMVRPTLSAHLNGHPNEQAHTGMAADPVQVLNYTLSHRRSYRVTL